MIVKVFPKPETPMNLVLQPWHLMVMFHASWVNRHQQEVIEYLRTENQMLQEKLGKKRILLNDDQRRRLAVKGKILGRKLLDQICTLFTPDTILRWHKKLIAAKWDYSDRKKKRQGRPRVRQVIVELTLRVCQGKSKRGAATGFRVNSPSSATQSATRQSPTFSKLMESIRHRIENGPAPGRRFSNRTGTCWLQSISRPSKSGPNTDWSHSICCL